jgi:hypothetical protein
MAEKILVNSDRSRDEFLAMAAKLYDEHKHLTFSYSLGKSRTLTQNRALHKFCDLLAIALNDAGLDQKKLLKPSIDIPWTQNAVKEMLWRPVQVAVTGIKSTTKPETSQYSAIYEVLNRHLSMKHGISVSWPTKEGEIL